MSVLDDLRQASSARQVQQAIARATDEELEARNGQGRALRETLAGCAARIGDLNVEMKEAIADFVGQAAQIPFGNSRRMDALAAAFRQQFTALTMGTEEDKDDLKETVEGTIASGAPVDQLLVAACDAPGNPAPWLVYADWLEERGEDAAWFRSDRFLTLWKNIPADYACQQQAYEGYRTQIPAIPPVPSLEAVLRTFSREQWQAIEDLESSRLILVPPIGLDAWRELFDHHHPRTSRQYPTYIDSLYDQHPYPAPAAWQAFFIEGEQNMPMLRAREREKLEPKEAAQREAASSQMRLAERLAAEERDHPAHVQGFDRYLYAASIFGSLERGAPLDTDTCTLLNADLVWQRVNLPIFPTGQFNLERGWAIFTWTPGVGYVVDSRMRRAVGGDVAA